LDKIFVPFKQVLNDSSKMGTGLGLTIARDLIRLMGGDIRVISKENRGTIFTFSTIFKMCDENIREEDVTSGFDHNTLMNNLKNKKILVVEDNEMNKILMNEIFVVFEKEDIEFATDGSEAVNKCRINNYDLIFMDIQMPIMDGIEATQIIRSYPQYSDIPIIALTANAFTEQKQEYLKNGMSDFLSKPIDINHLKDILIKYMYFS